MLRTIITCPVCMLAVLCILAAVAPADAQASAAEAYQRSYALETNGKYRQAIAALKGVSAQQRKTYFYQLRVGWLSYKAGRNDQAIAAYRRAAKTSPRAVEPLLGLMLPQMSLRRWQDAAIVARKVLRLAPSDFTANSRYAWCLYNLGRYAEAELVYRRVLEHYPSNIEMQAGLGWSLLKQGHKDEAKKIFAMVLALAPKLGSAQKGLALAGR